MNNEQKKGIVEALILALAHLGIEAVEHALDGLKAKHAELANPCPQGYHKDKDGVCVPDVGKNG